MNTKGLGCVATALMLPVAQACSSSSDGSSPPADTSDSAVTVITSSGSSGGKGAGTEQSILCLGNFYCNAGTRCCANMATESSACSTGPTCPFGQLQLCMSNADCGGATCTQIAMLGITFGTCGLGGALGGSSNSGGGSSSGSDDGGSSGGGDEAGDSSSAAAPDAPAG
jgi:hypothetical protein